MIRQHPPTQTAGDAIDLREYVVVLKRRKWVVALVVIAMLSIAALYSFTRPIGYTAHAEILIQPPTSSASFRPDQLVSVSTEASLASSALIAQLAKQDLDTSASVRDLVKRLKVSSDPESLVLDLTFTDPDPTEAADGANAFARAYLRYKQDQADEQFSTQQGVIQGRIRKAEDEQTTLLEQLADVPSGSSSSFAIQEELQNLNSRVAILTTQLLAVPVPSSPGQVILPAVAPTSPSSPQHPVNLALGLFLGLFFGVLAAFVRDRLDDRMSGWQDQEYVINAPVLATIPPIAGWSRKSSTWLVTEQQPRSAAAEAYRTLRTGVMSLARQGGMKTIAVVSATQGEGKSTTSAHLASALANANNRVLIVSADLRAPRIHDFFQVRNSAGVSDVLLGEILLEEAITTVAPNLWFLSAGAPPARPAELLHSQRFADLVRQVSGQYDFVVFDCAPVLGLADSLVIAPLVDGVLFACKSDVSRGGEVTRAIDSLRQAGCNIFAGVFIDLNPVRGGLYGHAEGYGYGYESDDDRSGSGAARSKRSRRRDRRKAQPEERQAERPSDASPPDVAETPTDRETLRKYPRDAERLRGSL